MELKIEANFFKLILFFCAATAVHCDCNVNFTTDKEQKPVFSRTLGSKVIKIKENEENFIELNDGETITANCATYFEPIFYYLPPPPPPPTPNSNSYYYNRYDDTTTTTQRSTFLFTKTRSIDLNCRYGSLYVDLEPFEISEDTIFSCESINFGIYETRKHLPWCSYVSSPYMLSITNLNRPEILGSVCYNLDRGMLESLRYTTHNFSEIDQHYISQANPIDLVPKLMSIKLKLEHFGQKFNRDDTYIKYNDELLKGARYVDRSIVQSQIFSKYFQAYDNILRVAQWKDHVNWQRFMKALDTRFTIKSYDVHLGVSGQLSFPKYKYCNGEETGEIGFYEDHSNVPAYIWSYVRAIDDSEEFVFVTYNSPYFEFFNSTDIIFCEDICSEISWLNKTRSTFRFTTMGLSFCCKPESVRNSTILQGFPKVYEPSQLVVTKTTTPTTTTTEASEIDDDIDWN